MKDDRAPKSFAIGSQEWPGLSKLIEEAGEVVQVAGKLLQVGGEKIHWDGDLWVRLEDELGDLSAAIWFFESRNLDRLRMEKIDERTIAKMGLFCKWHSERHHR